MNSLQNMVVIVEDGVQDPGRYLNLIIMHVFKNINNILRNSLCIFVEVTISTALYGRESYMNFTIKDVIICSYVIIFINYFS